MEEFHQKLVVAGVQAAGAICAVSIGAWFAIRKFHSEKRWEKREAAYTDLFRALQGMADHCECSLTKINSASFNHYDDVKQREQTGGLILNSFIELGEWHLSEKTIKALQDMRAEADSHKVADDSAHPQSAILSERNAYLKALRTCKAEARKKLKVKR